MEALPEALREQYPFTVKRHQTLWGSQSYVDEGEGPAVLLVHGNPTWSFMYRNLIPELVGRGFRCIAPDHLGCGLSDKPQSGFGYTLAEHIDNLVGLVDDELKLDHFHLVVHDWGGAIGMAVAARLAKRVGRIQVLNTAAWHEGFIPLRIALCRVPGLGQWLVRGLNAFAAGATVMAVQKPLSPQVKAGFVFPYGNWHDRIATHRFVLDIPRRPSHPSYQRLTEVEAGLELLKGNAMQVCWGMKDWCFDTRFLAGWRQRFPAAHIIEYPEAGHYLLEDAREEVIAAIADFLSA